MTSESSAPTSVPAPSLVPSADRPRPSEAKKKIVRAATVAAYYAFVGLLIGLFGERNNWAIWISVLVWVLLAFGISRGSIVAVVLGFASVASTIVTSLLDTGNVVALVFAWIPLWFLAQGIPGAVAYRREVRRSKSVDAAALPEASLPLDSSH